MFCAATEHHPLSPSWQSSSHGRAASPVRVGVQTTRPNCCLAVGILIALSASAMARAGEESVPADRSIVVASDRTPAEGDSSAATQQQRADARSIHAEGSADGHASTPSSQPALGTVARELRQIQQALGGSILDQGSRLGRDDDPFTPSDADSSKPQAVRRSLSSSQMQPNPQDYFQQRWPQPVVKQHAEPLATVGALRQTAAHLEAAANQLETLELYRQADSLRGLAQRLRIDARMLLAGRPMPSTATSPPSSFPPQASPYPAAAEPSPDPAGPREPTPAPARGTATARMPSAD